ncbi:hypothetical protein AGLY_018346 [Aphis glycines]|uniref:Mos1 transposase HTH domain-containing protein n=1 Tax=Aphis glycines TaxID=307491 RepID=A0A6G0STG0_APHGL|nr:hypothetical protein AGLY_018346 [Aphis glycines]
MPDEKIEQRINLKFLVKLGKSATKSFNLLTEVYGDSDHDHWHKRFREGREEVEDNQRVGRPCSSKTNDNISKINEIVQKDSRKDKDSLTTLRERVRRKRPELWENDSWIFHQDNAPAHMLQHPPYSPDLAPCDFWLFPKLKSALKDTHFESVEAVKTKATEVLKTLQEKDFQHCFNQWKIRMERCVKHGGDENLVIY